MKEETIIVNKQDEIIEYKYRDKIEHGKDIYRVSALRIENDKNEVLLAQRAFTKKSNPGTRGPAVAGTNEKGETYLGNILKEYKEELGGKSTPDEIMTGPKRFIDVERKYFCQWFFIKTDKLLEDFTIQKEEVERIMRISKPTLLEDLNTSPEKFTSSAPTYIPMMLEFSEHL